MSAPVFPVQCLTSEDVVLNEKVNQIIDLIPNDFENKRKVRRKLRAFQRSKVVTCSDISLRWVKLIEILERDLPSPTEVSWAGDISHIFIQKIAESWQD